MARQSDNEHVFHPKHRIIGAIIIVSLAVIFLPMVLQDSPDFNTESIRLGGMPDKNTKTKVYVAKVEPRSHVISTQVKPNSDQAAAPKKLPKRTKTAAIKKKQASKRIAKAKTTSTQAGSGKGWMIQVGTFTNQNNVTRVTRQLQQAGFKVKLADVGVSGKKAVRIRVGPFTQKGTAKKQLARINAMIGLEGMVVAKP